jgi:hypothetical protein
MMYALAKMWLGIGVRDERRRLTSRVELRPSRTAPQIPQGDSAIVTDVGGAPGWMGVVATIREGCGETTVWVSDQLDAFPTGGGFVFSGIGAVPRAGLRQPGDSKAS